MPLNNYCTNCGLGLLSEAENVCPQCGYDQKTPIAKKITNPHEMAHAIVSFGWNMCMNNDKYIDDLLVDGYRTRLDQPKKNQLFNVFLLSDLAITSIVYLAHYEDNPKHDEIITSFKEALEDRLLHEYGEEDFQVMKSCLDSMIEDYYKAFTEKDWLRSVSTVLQYSAESVILDRPQRVPMSAMKLFVVPSIHANMKYYIYISELLIPFKTVLNKWEIE